MVVLERAGFTQLDSDTPDEWSYSFDGTSGSLDHVLANDAALGEVDGVDIWESRWRGDFQVTQNRGIGLIAQGTGKWRDYTVSATVKSPLAASAGIAARIGGMRRYYALLLAPNGKAQLVRALDGDTALAETDFAWSFGVGYALRLQVVGTHIQGWIGDRLLFDVRDDSRPLDGGGVALVVTEGRMGTDVVTVRPASSSA